MSESKIRRYALPRCRQHRVYVDIGASVGHTCHPFLPEFQTVHAWEPNPHSFARLTLIPGAHYHPEALSDHSGEATLIIPRHTGNPEHGSIDPDRQQRWDCRGTEQYRVQIRTLDSYRLDRVDLIKIDVEQHERSVIRGARDTIQRCRPVIMIENKRQENQTVISQLRGWGYDHSQTRSEIIAYPL